jgi:hypothetical protein
MSEVLFHRTMSFGLGLALAGSLFAAESLGTQSAAKPTFTKDIAPIFQEKCEVCHRPGSMAPMSLVTYEETRPWARSIKERVIRRQMPPWHLDPTVGIQSFENDRSLSDAQIATIVKWVDAGAPQGDPKDMPPAKQFPNDDEWQLAKKYGRPPDLIIKSTDYTMPAVSQDQWWKPVTDLNLNEERWVQAVEMRPGTPGGRKITHHAIAHLIQQEPKGDTLADNGDLAAAAQGGILMEWAIGKQYDVYRPNTGTSWNPARRFGGISTIMRWVRRSRITLSLQFGCTRKASARSIGLTSPCSTPRRMAVAALWTSLRTPSRRRKATIS